MARESGPETRYLLRDEPDLFEEGRDEHRRDRRDRDRDEADRFPGGHGGCDAHVGGEPGEIVRKAKNTPDFWSGDNPVLVALALTIVPAQSPARSTDDNLYR